MQCVEPNEMNRIFAILLVLITLVSATLPASSQEVRYRRSPRQIVKGGIMPKADSLRHPSIDSLLGREMVDSLARLAADSVGVDSLLRLARQTAQQRGMIDSARMAAVDSLREEQLPDSLFNKALLDSLERGDSLLAARSDTILRRKGWLMSDSMSLSKVCWISTVLPGYGQIYNKQYWKLPILYGTVAAGITMYAYETKQYKPLKQVYDEVTLTNRSRTEALDNLQAEMIRHNTRRQAYLLASIASYVYFIGDAAVNYSTNDVSDVKKATTLACICPGAGQIYNKSYWKVPFVVGGFSAVIYCVDWNNRGYQRFKKAYSLRADYDKALEEYRKNPTGKEEPKPQDEFNGRYQASYLKNLRDNYRRNRDLCIIITAGLYVLQIIDAHVDAQLKDYDISDDLSMDINPHIGYAYSPMQGGNRATIGMNLNINF